MINRIIFLLLLFLMVIPAYAQEICDNGIDDDLDGQIDLNDDECLCERTIPTSLIPNPSFEEKSCCPQENARLDCAVGWIQASAPTTDYVHTCGNYLGNTNIPAYAPLPFPDGEGGVGFRDGQQHVGPNYKEYVGACLTAPMEVGKKYRLDFYVGFRDNVSGSKNLNMAIFGATSCSFLPFGGNSNTIGCPVNSGLYTSIGEQNVSGSDEWVNVAFEFFADQAYEVLILGPACETNPNYIYDPYFYLDQLVFAESNLFGEPFNEIEGSICEGGVSLSVEPQQDYTYQWYKDGIALPGETGNSIFLTPGTHEEGVYLVRITTPDGCYLSRDYDLRIPPYYETVRDSICSNEIYQFGNEELEIAGYYERTIKALDGCDSIIQLTLDVLSTSEAIFFDTICQGEDYSYLDIVTNEGGSYYTSIPNSLGCDSLIQLDLTEIPIGDQLSLPGDFEIELGEIIDISPLYVDPGYTDLYWSSSDSFFITKDAALLDFIPLNSTTIYLNATDEYGCPVKDSIDILVRKSNYTLYVPNVFSPNGDHLNDYFNFKLPPSVDHIVRFSIFDRWGNLVFHSDFPSVNGSGWGWDGKMNGQLAAIGVYSYLIEARFIDGYEKIFPGDITLLR